MYESNSSTSKSYCGVFLSYENNVTYFCLDKCIRLLAIKYNINNRSYVDRYGLQGMLASAVARLSTRHCITIITGIVSARLHLLSGR